MAEGYIVGLIIDADEERDGKLMNTEDTCHQAH
jgi:hypothetical protein